MGFKFICSILMHCHEAVLINKPNKVDLYECLFDFFFVSDKNLVLSFFIDKIEVGKSVLYLTVEGKSGRNHEINFF